MLAPRIRPLISVACQHVAMTTDPAQYEAQFTAVPYAGRVLPHLQRYLDVALSSVIGGHGIVIGLDNEVDSSREDYDVVTVTIRFTAASEAEASANAAEAAAAVGQTDEHWRITGHSVRW